MLPLGILLSFFKLSARRIDARARKRPESAIFGIRAMFGRLGITALLVFGLSACADLVLLERLNAPGDADSLDAAGLSSDEDPAVDEIMWGLDNEDAANSQFALASPPTPRRKPDRSEAVVIATPDPDLLVGLDFEATKALLGDPVLRMEQPPAKVWAYKGGSCMFSVFFYPSVDDSVFRVLTYEVTDREPELPLQTASRSSDTGAARISDSASPVLRRCFADLLQERNIHDAG